MPDPTSLPRHFPLSMGFRRIRRSPECPACRTHQQAGRGLVAAAEQDDAIDRIGPRNSILDIHRRQGCGTSIAVGRNVLSPVEKDREFHREAPRLVNPAFTRSARSRKMRIARRELDQVLQMPMIGRPSKWFRAGSPWFFIRSDAMMAFLPVPPNHVLRTELARPLSFLLHFFLPCALRGLDMPGLYARFLQASV